VAGAYKDSVDRIASGSGHVVSLDVEDLLAERGLSVSYETIRR
jgi:hypothetical protein